MKVELALKNYEHLYSDRLTYRLVETHDLQKVHELHSIAAVDRFNTLGIPETMEETETILNNWITENRKEHLSQKTYAMELADRRFIGLFGIKFSNSKYSKAEIWFKLNPEFWNQGYATESLHHFLKECFKTHHLHRVEAGCAVENIASKKVLEKCGFLTEGVKRKNLPLKSGWSDNYEFGILEEEWNK